MTNDTSAPAATSSKPRHFPPKDSPSLHITQPTTSEEHTQSVANSTEWRGALALESYLRRELHLAKQDLTRSGGITYWVLVDSAEDVADGGQLCLYFSVVARSCSSFVDVRKQIEPVHSTLRCLNCLIRRKRHEHNSLTRACLIDLPASIPLHAIALVVSLVS